MEVAAKAFWSYAHTDNDHEQGRILRLADLVQAEFELLTGTTIKIFTDKVEIRWGDDFRQRIAEALQETAFFIPILTPTYFVREECRKEMSQFIRSANALGLNQLLLSIRYIPVADLNEDSADELKAQAARMQYERWDALRLLDENSAQHRAAVHNLASTLVNLTSRLESAVSETPGGSLAPALRLDVAAPPTQPREPDTPVSALPGSSQIPQEGAHSSAVAPAPEQVGAAEDEDDEEPGLLDLVADAQPAMEAWTTTLNKLSPATERFNAKISTATDRMNAVNSKPDAFARKLLIARGLAAEVEPDLEEIERLSREYSAGLLRLDPTIHAVFELAKSSTDEDSEQLVASIAESISELVAQARQAQESMIGAADAAAANAKLSRDLRPILRRYATAVRNIADGFEIIEEWETLGDTDGDS